MGAAMHFFLSSLFDRSPILPAICLCLYVALFFTTFYLFHVRERSMAWAALGTLAFALFVAVASPVIIE